MVNNYNMGGLVLPGWSPGTITSGIRWERLPSATMTARSSSAWRDT